MNAIDWKIPCIWLKNGKAARDFTGRPDRSANPVSTAETARDNGARAVIVFDLSDGDAEHEINLHVLREICRAACVPVYGAGNIRRLEDVKKLLYAGCTRVFLNFERESNRELLPEASERFGTSKIGVYLPDVETAASARPYVLHYASAIMTEELVYSSILSVSRTAYVAAHAAAESVDSDSAWNESGRQLDELPALLFDPTDRTCLSVNVPKSEYTASMDWEAFKTCADGLIPCIVQDDRTGDVLMLAYMNRDAYRQTVETGRMTYWSRSRQEIWVKGLTSGHLQFVKSLWIDCDNDTILARVIQLGAACHTGNRSCFYRPLQQREGKTANTGKVLDQVYAVIADRKQHPRQGSYTNYLFDKGLDKILKKVGEETTEIVIAAKNPGTEETVYEISDLMYHIMVLMAEKGITWEDIAEELANRE